MAGYDSRFRNPDISRQYSKFRPSYPPELTTQILVFHGKNGTASNLAVDVGCGTGKSTLWLGQHFTRIIGIDPSPTQLERADRGFRNVEYREGQAEDLSFLPDESVDLVTIAMALHYVDEDIFFQQVSRILKPGGTFAVYGYGFQFFDEDELTDIWFQYIEKHVVPYCSWRTGHYTLSKCENVALPFPAQQRFDYIVRKDNSLDDFIGFNQSTGAYSKMMKEDPNSTALKELHSQLLCGYERIYGKSDKNPTLKFWWPYFLLLASKG